MHPGSVHEHNLPSALAFTLGDVDHALNAVSRGLRLGRNNRKLLSDERIEQRGLSRVGAAENANETGAEWHRKSDVGRQTSDVRPRVSGFILVVVREVRSEG